MTTLFSSSFTTTTTTTTTHPASPMIMTPIKNPKTPLRMKAPRMSPSPSYSSARKRRSHRSSLQKYRCSGTPSFLSPSSSSCDRFIPNRSRTNPSHARANLTNCKNDGNNGSNDDVPSASMDASTTSTNGDQRNDNGCIPAVTTQNQAYERQLRQALFGTEDCEPRLLSFGDNSSSVPRSSLNVAEDPFRQDVLRTTATPSSSSSSSSLSSWSSRDSTTMIPSRREVSIKPEFILNAPLVLQNEFLNVVSYGPMIAVGLDRAVYFSNRGHADESQEVFESIDHGRDFVTAVQWSSDRVCGRSSFLAFGTKGCAEVWDPLMHQQVAHLGGHIDYVTALAWGEETSRPMELFAASFKGIQRYDLRLPFPHVESYGCDDGACPITSLQCRGNYTAASYDDTVRVWDVRKCGKPLHRLHHANAKALEFCPFQPDILASGGSDGVRVWKLRHQPSSSGESAILRAHIPTSSPVTTLLWSPYRRELLTGYGEHLAVWNMSSNAVKSPLAEWTNGEGDTVLSMARDPRSGHVLSLHSHEKLVCWDAFGKPPRDSHRNGYKVFCGWKSGLFDMPVVR